MTRKLDPRKTEQELKNFTRFLGLSLFDTPERGCGMQEIKALEPTIYETEVSPDGGTEDPHSTEVV